MVRSACTGWTALAVGLLALFLLSFSPVRGWASPALQPTVGVSALDYRFEPQDLPVLAGTTVVWTNNGIAPHTTTSSSAVWDSGTLSPGQSFSLTFDTPGSFPYHCLFHQGLGLGMSGVVTVVAPTAKVYLPFLARNSIGW